VRRRTFSSAMVKRNCKGQPAMVKHKSALAILCQKIEWRCAEMSGAKWPR
jgi:hypothetical protein